MFPGQLDCLQNELEEYSAGLSGRPSAIVANKIDLPESRESIKKLQVSVTPTVYQFFFCFFLLSMSSNLTQNVILKLFISICGFITAFVCFDSSLTIRVVSWRCCRSLVGQASASPPSSPESSSSVTRTRGLLRWRRLNKKK